MSAISRIKQIRSDVSGPILFQGTRHVQWSLGFRYDSTSQSIVLASLDSMSESQLRLIGNGTSSLDNSSISFENSTSSSKFKISYDGSSLALGDQGKAVFLSTGQVQLGIAGSILQSSALLNLSSMYAAGAHINFQPGSGYVSPQDGDMWYTGTTLYFRTGSTTLDLFAATGTVTSVGLVANSIFTVSGSPITSSGNITLNLQIQGPNTFLAGPTSGSAIPTFRSMSMSDLPSSGVFAGTYNNVTVNSKGVVTSASNVAYATSASNAITLSSGTITWEGPLTKNTFIDGHYDVTFGNTTPLASFDVTATTNIGFYGTANFTISSDNILIDCNTGSGGNFTIRKSGLISFDDNGGGLIQTGFKIGSGNTQKYLVFDDNSDYTELGYGNPTTVNRKIISIDASNSIRIGGLGTYASTFAGLAGYANYSANYTSLSYVQKAYVDGKFLPLTFASDQTLSFSGHKLSTDGTIEHVSSSTVTALAVLNDTMAIGAGDDQDLDNSAVALGATFFSSNSLASSVQLVSRHASGSNDTRFTVYSDVFNGHINVFSGDTGFQGIIYTSNWDANFTPDSLVTKRYVDNAVSVIGSYLPLSFSGNEILNFGNGTYKLFTNGTIAHDSTYIQTAMSSVDSMMVVGSGDDYDLENGSSRYGSARFVSTAGSSTVLLETSHTAGNVSLNINSTTTTTNVLVSSSQSGFQGIVYVSNWDANFVNDSLVTKRYVDNAVSVVGSYLPLTLMTDANVAGSDHYLSFKITNTSTSSEIEQKNDGSTYEIKTNYVSDSNYIRFYSNIDNDNVIQLETKASNFNHLVGASNSSTFVLAQNFSNGHQAYLNVVANPQTISGQGSNNNLIVVDTISNKGFLGAADFSPNYTTYSYVQKIYVDTNFAPISGGAYVPLVLTNDVDVDGPFNLNIGLNTQLVDFNVSANNNISINSATGGADNASIALSTAYGLLSATDGSNSTISYFNNSGWGVAVDNGVNVSSIDAYIVPVTLTSNGSDNVLVVRDDISHKGFVGFGYYAANYTPNSYVQKKWVDDNFLNIAGVVPVTGGGTGTSTAFTQGSVVFAGTSGTYNQDNANFFWNDTTNRLGIGTNSPSRTLHIGGATRTETVTGSIFDIQTSTVSTSTNVPTSIDSYVVPNDSTMTLECRVQCRKTSGSGAGSVGDSCSFVKIVRAKNVSGTVTLGAIQSSYTSKDISTCDVDFGISGGSVTVVVTGATSDNIDWNCSLVVTA